MNHLSEKTKGAITSVVSGSLSSLAHMLGVSAFNMSAPVSAFWFLYVFGNVLSYSMDIVFAKEKFFIHGRYVVVPHRDLMARLHILARYLVSHQTWKFAISALLDTLLGLIIIVNLIKILDHERIFQQYAKWRNAAIALAVPTFTFFLFVNILRFNWAYKHTSSTELTVLIVLITALTFAWFVQSKASLYDKKSEPPKECRAAH